jgi:ankyrin repeat protein
MACAGGELGIVKLLIQQGADLDAIDSFDCTSLFQAARKGDLDLVEYLLQQGANIHIPNHYGCNCRGRY